VDVGTVEAYWQAHMDLLIDEPRLELLDREWVIHTRSEERPPVSIRDGAVIRRSLIANGCVIEGIVEDSVLSPGVVVRPGAQVRRSVVMTDAVVGENGVVDRAILDKRVHVGVGARIGGADASSVEGLTGPNGGITVVGKNTRLPAGVCVGQGCTIAADLGEQSCDKDTIPSGTSIGVVGE